jgi:hypothetical protein
MPSVLRRSGPDFERDGKLITPRALVSTCDTCGADAAFSETIGGKLVSYCGWRNGQPECVGKGTS